MSTMLEAPAEADHSFLGHPRGLAYLAFTEAWERFSYYGMQTLLVLYMVRQLLHAGHIERIVGFTAFRATLERAYGGPLSTVALASAIFGLYTGLVYLTPIAGGSASAAITADPPEATLKAAVEVDHTDHEALVAVPLLSYRKHRFEVLGVKPEGPGVISVYIGGRRFEELDAEPGQFFRWRFLTRSLWWSSHPFSLSAAPGADMMRITVKNLGDHSQALARLQPGTRIFAEGPYGALTAGDSDRGVLLLAGGVGITPLRAIFATLPGRVTLIYRASSERDIVVS